MSQRGIILSFFAALVFSVMNVFVKLVAPRLPVIEVVFFRSLISLVLLLLHMRRRRYSFRSSNLPLLILRGLLGTLGLVGIFYMIAYIKLGEMGIILQMTPVFVVLLAFVFLKEKPARIFYILFLISLVGVFLIIRPLELGNLPALIGFGAVVLAAGAYVCVRKLGQDHNPYLIILSFAFFSTLISAPLALIDFVVPSGREIFYLLGVGLTATLGQILLTNAYKCERAGIVAMVGYTGVFFNIVFGYLIWDERLDFYTWLGGGLILLSCLLLTFVKKDQSSQI